ncbi:hypothetical protein [Deinococcus maricopensis]|uniref:ADP-ribosylation/crystallin J1 n=1 Tax=Deinococcus maricopensis (strain DSM 21211 / LMG 22137 / NRRL B-23946 / LB-34) TaxID=709986 RepID=E8U646_DEIML|nr:hypothetical protein [Deinococcus maricopensis]ADV66535.1 hypothetical protein Deima_0881 [Deinococcus maricopensis DSM 21211]
MTRDDRWLDTLFPKDTERTAPWPPVGETVTLYRPVGEQELTLIADTDFRAFPPRLPDQPIFYPVLNFPYAEEIARDWNARHNTPPVGYVTAFEVDARVATGYAIQIVGREDRHQELWVPAEELGAFNAAIRGPIRVLAHHVGEQYEGHIDPDTHLPEPLRRTPQ